MWYYSLAYECFQHVGKDLNVDNQKSSFRVFFFFLAKIESQSLALSLNVKEQIIGIVNWIVQTFSMFSMAHEQLLWKNSVVFAFGCSAGK